MLRLLSFATLFLIAACLIISASIALADATGPTSAEGRDDLDVYEFDFEIPINATPHPEHDEFIVFQDI